MDEPNVRFILKKKFGPNISLAPSELEHLMTDRKPAILPTGPGQMVHP